MLEWEATKHLDKVAASSTLTTDSTVLEDMASLKKQLEEATKGLNEAKKQIAEQRAELSALSAGGGGQGGSTGSGTGKPKKVCWWARDHGTCKHEKTCKFDHDPERLKAARAENEAKKAEESLASTDGGEGDSGKKPKAKPKAKAQAPSREEKQLMPCPFLAQGECKRGSLCDFLHSTTGGQTFTRRRWFGPASRLGRGKPFCLLCARV